MTGPASFHVGPGGKLTGRTRVPGDKSISHRALILGAIAEGVTEIDGVLDAADTRATAAALRALGVAIAPLGGGRTRVRGRGLHGLEAPAGPLDLGNSGTAMRLLAGLLAGQRFDSLLAGDASLSRRPMARVIEPLTAMGARITAAAGATAPLAIRGGQALTGIEHRTPVASAQVKSCLLLAALYARGRTRISEPAPSRDHTERMLAGFGYALDVLPDGVALAGGGRLRGRAIRVPGDLSSAAFLLVGASIAAGSELLLEGVGVNPTRSGVLAILALMGARIEVTNRREVAGEPVADLRVTSAPLKGVEIPPALVPPAIDEFPALFIAAACASGETVLTGASELRVKESDRIAVMAAGLARLGGDVVATRDGVRIRGGALRGGRVSSHGDHRVAMAFAVAGLAASGAIEVLDCANVETSFPGFAATARGLGLAIRIRGGG